MYRPHKATWTPPLLVLKAVVLPNRNLRGDGSVLCNTARKSFTPYASDATVQFYLCKNPQWPETLITFTHESVKVYMKAQPNLNQILTRSQLNHHGCGSFFAYDEFIMRREIWMSQICHAHNCRAVQKNRRCKSYVPLSVKDASHSCSRYASFAPTEKMNRTQSSPPSCYTRFWRDLTVLKDSWPGLVK